MRNLDKKNAEQVMTLFKNINSELKQTILMVSHDNDLLKACGKRYDIRDAGLEMLGI